ncbi:retrovirus-related Pol polyprotein from transposon TNT 1-94, partial [Trifolium medium]|nr:retrovirus-related Pol polyprotein from transposon TNT 1-94 [Trifolium medium]
MATASETATDSVQDSPVAPPPTASTASSKNILKAFAQHITIKLDESNFLSWKQQVEGIIRTHKLHRHLVNPQIPSKYLSVADNEVDRENPTYAEWEQRDSLLFTWLLTTLSDSVLPRVVRCVQAHEVWSAIDVFYRTQIIAKSRELRSELKSITKGERTITAYLARIQQIVNTLESIGDPISVRDHMETILEGLSEDYNALSAVIQYRDSDGPCPVLVAEAMLLTHKSRLERMKKATIIDPVSVNITQATQATSEASSQITQSFQASSQPNDQFAQSSENYVSSYGGRGG